ncbi:MAG: AAA domain-containing protein [Corynebacterium sp.]|nr:AAA domain-containing protein [Corynebacterium sp.]
MLEQSAKVEKAVHLFQYLAQARRLREKTTTNIKKFEQDGAVFWLSDIASQVQENDWPLYIDQQLSQWLLGEYQSTDYQLNWESEKDGTLFVASRVAQMPPPSVPENIRPWIVGAVDNCNRRPKISLHSNVKLFKNQSDAFREQVEQWFCQWDSWAKHESYRKLYNKLFDAHINASQSSEEFELVLGMGLLSWNYNSANSIKRHLFTVGLKSSHDKTTGEICLQLEDVAATFKTELNFIPAEALQDRTFVSDVVAKAAAYSGHVFDVNLFGELGKITAHSLATSAVYSPVGNAQEPTSIPVVSWAPAVILRKRENVGFAMVYDKIAAQIEEEGEIPFGLRTLVDPDDTLSPAVCSEPGAVVTFCDDVFSPLPLNEVQRRIIERVDTYSQTVVQGPPGTGKTHMAAALLSHFLAQGKRVLVTAETDRALYEVRDKLPEEIRELAVAVIGTSTDDMASLKLAVDKISRSSSEFDVDESRHKIQMCEDRLAELQEERQDLLQRIAIEFCSKAKPVEVFGKQYRPGELVQKLQYESKEYQWIREFSADITGEFPLNVDEVSRYRSLITHFCHVNRDFVAASGSIDIEKLPRLIDFNKIDQKIETLEIACNNLHSSFTVEEKSTLRDFDKATRDAVLETAKRVESVLTNIRQFSQLWVSDLIDSYYRGQLHTWRVEVEQLQCSIQKVNELLLQLASYQRIESTAPLADYLPYASNLLKYLEKRGPLQTDAYGVVKIHFWSPTIVKQGTSFFKSVTLDGAQPSTAEQVRAVIARIQLDWMIDPLVANLPRWLKIASSTPEMIVFQLKNDLHDLVSALEMLEDLPQVSRLLQQFSYTQGAKALPKLIQTIESYNLVCKLSEELSEKVSRLNEMDACAHNLLSNYKNMPWVGELHKALKQRDGLLAEKALREASALAKQFDELKELEKLETKLEQWSPRLVQKLNDLTVCDDYLEKLNEASEAVHWLACVEQIECQRSLDISKLQREVQIIEEKIQKEVCVLAAERAWNRALRNDRITGKTRKNLVEYAQSVKRLGKGKGKYANQRRREIRRALDNCRSAVPVWIMPLHRVIDQLDLQKDMFDVVMIDEASQAGAEAVFLQYLAPTIVVIGDDKQVSPSAVGVSEQEIRKLADQYLKDDDDKTAWCDPQRSLFDVALARFGGRLTLTEHRRCVPEIIEFSNQIAYEPDNIRLVPVRQPAVERLDPIKVVHTPFATQGTGRNKINKHEADALVAQVIDCVNDPAYQDKTIGVISLLSSSGQADYIQTRLLDELSPHVWEQHQLRVGSPAEFQGAERDVIFLSMVSSKSENQNLAALTTDTYIQRYNVAVSRARDQVWLFHSLGVEQIFNSEDIRFQLLKYAYDVAGKRILEQDAGLVSDDVRDERFDSLFEQRVYNKIVARGYKVIPQFKVGHYKIDLVAQGVDAYLAIECDGDKWHGQEGVERALRQQRELERCGWNFIRIFEADFYADPEGQMERVWCHLDFMNISPNDTRSTDRAANNVTVLERPVSPKKMVKHPWDDIYVD